MFWVLVLRKIIFSLLLVGVLVSVWFAGLASAASTNNTSTGTGLLFYAFKNHKSGGTWPVLLGFIIIGIAVYIYFKPSVNAGKPRSPSALASGGGKSPRSYDFLAKIVDDEKRMIYDEKYVKLSKNIYINTDVSKPSFLYIPDDYKPYICRYSKGRTTYTVPCGLAYKRNIMAMILDSELATANDMAEQAGLISTTTEEMDKLLAELFARLKEKTGYIPISPNLSVAFSFDIKNMTRRYINVLREADNLMIHFLNVAGQAESVERLIRSATELQKARFSWLKWIVYIMFALGIVVSMILTVGH